RFDQCSVLAGAVGAAGAVGPARTHSGRGGAERDGQGGDEHEQPSETLHGNHPSLESRRATLFLGANPLTVTGGNGLRLGSQCSGRGGLTASAVRAQPRKPESTTGTRAKGARDRSAAAQREAARAARVGPGCRGPSATAGSGEQGAAPRFRAGPSRERWASPAVGG